jgi:hypothetical protein
LGRACLARPKPKQIELVDFYPGFFALLVRHKSIDHASIPAPHCRAAATGVSP